MRAQQLKDLRKKRARRASQSQAKGSQSFRPLYDKAKQQIDIHVEEVDDSYVFSDDNDHGKDTASQGSRTSPSNSHGSAQL